MSLLPLLRWLSPVLNRAYQHRQILSRKNLPSLLLLLRSSRHSQSVPVQPRPVFWEWLKFRLHRNRALIVVNQIVVLALVVIAVPVRLVRITVAQDLREVRIIVVLVQQVVRVEIVVPVRLVPRTTVVQDLQEVRIIVVPVRQVLRGALVLFS